VAARDLNGDGLADIVAGAGPGALPQVSVYSGAGATLLQSFFALNPNPTNVMTPDTSDHAGVRVGTALVAGNAAILTGSGPGRPPLVDALSGQTLALLDTFFAFNTSFLGGVFVGG
jgi:hypothetical protein